jgi:hypothetical protein
MSLFEQGKDLVEKAVEMAKDLAGFGPAVAAIEEGLQQAVREAATVVARDAEFAEKLAELDARATRPEAISAMGRWVDDTRATFVAPPAGEARSAQHRAQNVLAPLTRLEKPAPIVNGQPVYVQRSERPGPPDFSKVTWPEWQCWVNPTGVKRDLEAAILAEVPETIPWLAPDKRARLAKMDVHEQAEAIRGWRDDERARLTKERAAVVRAHERVRQTMADLKGKLQALIDPLPQTAAREHDEEVTATNAARDIERQRLEREVNRAVPSAPARAVASEYVTGKRDG